jgi:hypothetical protein
MHAFYPTPTYKHGSAECIRSPEWTLMNALEVELPFKGAVLEEIVNKWLKDDKHY